MTDAIKKFLDHMSEWGCEPHTADDIIADDVRRYYRLAGDKPGVKKGSYVLRVDPDGFAVGGCMTMRDLQWHGWHSRAARGASEEEKAEWLARRDAARVAREAQEAAERVKAVESARRMWSEGVPAERHPYAARKHMRLDGLRVWFDDARMEDVLLVPVWNRGEMAGLQRIYSDGEKLFTAGCDMAGGHVWIGSPDGAAVVAIGEGYATCDSVVQATGWPVCVAFNAGNLKAVAERVRKGWPDAQVVILADEDLWTWDHKHRKHKPEELPSKDTPEWQEWREKGWLKNVGRIAAEQAAAAICGAQVLGVTEGGDWNDLHVSAGLDEVSGRLVKPVEIAQDWEPDYEVGPTWDEAAHPADRLSVEIRPQGYIGKKYYFFPRSTGDIEEFALGELSNDATYYHLAEDTFWKSFFDNTDKVGGKDIVAQFKPVVMRLCKQKGKFDPDRVLSTGIWPDGKGGVVANMGDRLYIPGVGFLDHSEYDSDKVYVSAPKSMNIDVPAMANKEAVKLRQICEGLSWRHRISGSLLAGWIYASILSGALRWRPHIFVTGGKGSGKTTVMRDIIKAILRGWSTNADGGTTGAGFRRKLGNQARPVVSDEMETETKKQRDNADDVLTLARQSSSGAEYANAYVDITVHSCFCFGGINPNIKHGADKDRITELELVKDRADGWRDRWNDREREIKATFSGDYGRRLARRAIDNADAFLANVETFEDELSVILGDSRSAEQFAPMIAGLYGLHSTGRINAERAREWVREQDWDFFYQEDEGSDAEKMVSHLLTAMAEFTLLDRTNKVAVSDLIKMVMDCGNNATAARDSLGRYGLRVDGSEWLVVANSKSRIGELMRDTSWTVPKNTLARYPGAEPVGTTRFAPGVISRGIRIPLAGLIDGVDVIVEEEIPFEGEGF